MNIKFKDFLRQYVKNEIDKKYFHFLIIVPSLLYNKKIIKATSQKKLNSENFCFIFYLIKF